MAYIGWLLGVSLIMTALLCILLSVPLLQGQVKMNRVYGIRFKKAFESEQLWYQINAYGARRIILWSVVVLAVGVAAFFVDFGGAGAVRSGRILAFGCAPLIVLIPCLETYLYTRKL